MSSRHSKKHHHKSREKAPSEEWSEWSLDQTSMRYYQSRDVNGKREYKWDESAPRTIPSESSSQSTTSGSAAGGDSSNYKYAVPDQAGESVEALSSKLGNTTLSGQASGSSSSQGSLSTIPYTSSSSTLGYPGSQPIPINTNSGIYSYSSSAKTVNYGINYGGMGTTVSGSSAAYYEGGSETGMGSFSSYSTTPKATGPWYQSTSKSAGLSGTNPVSSSGREQPSEAGESSKSGALKAKADRVIKGTQGSEERLDPSFRIHHSKRFEPGQVIKVLWSEPMGGNYSNATQITEEVVETKLGEQVYTTTRRFVIIANDHGHCQCLPILTYQRQATNKLGVKREEHAMIYTGDSPPQPLPGESPLEKRPIQMIPKTPREKLDPASRINYAKYYTVEHNVKVKFIGKLAPSSYKTFVMDSETAWNNKIRLPQEY
ncbi:uncharacterized protein BP5553_09036 [Venustampulla echinocandica]|uniref:DUF6590 domain-containing protein n=1 Tax=Venustampulla echinocandica TaxID=2656787 RepID=A0A370TDN7_9HELO|nr:uncharacterized protein BP5553_09036 [Venustampulla echinocandica]RDL32580.1 hypothetical protein BP5553_09036 [Venustampulla echinocandica]